MADWVAVVFERSAKVYYYKSDGSRDYEVGQQLSIHNSGRTETLTVVSVDEGPGSGNRMAGGRFMAYKVLEERLNE